MIRLMLLSCTVACCTHQVCNMMHVVLQEKSKEAASFTAEKVQQGASYTGEKAQVLAGATADKAIEAKEAVQNKFSDEEPPKPEPKRRGPFGLFGKS